MESIIDYLKNRKHIPFTSDPFNEVDGLVLSELVYASFDELLNADSDVALEYINRQFWVLHSESEIMASTSYTKMAPFLMKEMAGSPRYKGMRFRHYVTNTSLQAIRQFAAITFVLPDGSAFVAYRGTDGTVVGWMEDFKFSFSTTDGQNMAVAYLDRIHKDSTTPLRIGGHSKGGNLAVYAATYCNRAIQDRIERIYSYDGPGFQDAVLRSSEYKRILPRVLSVVPKECVFGVMMHNQYKTIVTNADSFSVFQHDAYQWHIDGNHFEELPSRNERSLFFEEVLNNWLNRFDEDKRAEMLNVVLSFLTENGILKSEQDKLGPEFYHALLMHTSKLTDNEKSLLHSSLSDVLVSASVVTKNEIKTKTEAVLERITHKHGA